MPRSRSWAAVLLLFAGIAACSDRAPTSVVHDDAIADGPANTPRTDAVIIGVTKKLLISPVGLDFGDVQTGTTAPAQTVSVRNVSGAPMVINMAGGAPAAPFGASQACQSVTLAPGAACLIYYTFDPTTVGTATSVSTGSLNGQSFNIALRGNGVGARFRVSSVALDFGDVPVGANVQLAVTFTNIGLAPVVGSIAGGAAGPFGGSQNCQGVTIAVGASCQVFYTFTPTTDDVITASTNGSMNGQPFAFTFRGRGVLPSFRISPTSLDFGEVRIGQSLTLPVMITNTGLRPEVGSIAGGAAGAFGGSQNCQSVTIAVGASCQVFYTFTPSATGIVNGSTNGSMNGQPFDFTFTGKGIGASAATTVPYRISARALDFGTLQVGSSTTLAIDFTNISGATIIASVAGGAAGAFGGSQNCQGNAIAPGASCQIFYTFQPTAAGVITASTSGNMNGQPFAFTFKGTGAAPSFRISPTTLDFGRVQIGQSLTLPVTITNIGRASVSGSIAGGAAGPFGGSQNCQSITLAVGASCQIFYTFQPTAAGVVNSSTNGSFNGQPFGFSFTGTGVTPSFRVTPFAFDFGEIMRGSASPTQQVTVTNTGMAPVSVDIAGGAAGMFGGSQNCQGNTLAIGASCQIFYQFVPTMVGPITASTSGSLSGQPFAFSFMGVGLGSEEVMDLSPATISLSGTPTVSVVLLSSTTLNATTVALNNVRLQVNGGIDVAPVSRGNVVTSSTRDWNGDGKLDRMFSFRTADLVAAGFNVATDPTRLLLHDDISSSRWQARDGTLPAIVP